MSARALLNRPMLAEDFDAASASPWAAEMRAMVRDYTRAALPVMNGSFLYSNLRQGDDQILTCGPYRLWEYTSLFLKHDDAAPWRRFLDVGGAASALPYFLAERGIAGRAVDLQPLLVAVCKHVAAVRGIPLTADVADVTADSARDSYDLVTCVSVLEHVPPERRAALLAAFFRLLQPGGLLYLTFDYGDYVEHDVYQGAAGAPSHASSSVSDLGVLCETLQSCGFVFEGNDPRELPAEVLALRRAPRANEFMRRHALNNVPFDAATPWRAVAKYAVKRAVPFARHSPTRYDRHNFFRMFLRRPA
jgi:SAM-dependent methyltransferase